VPLELLALELLELLPPLPVPDALELAVPELDAPALDEPELGEPELDALWLVAPPLPPDVA
jgi:hypothetical protein